jgi:hypothetical protein
LPFSTYDHYEFLAVIGGVLFFPTPYEESVFFSKIRVSTDRPGKNAPVEYKRVSFYLC